MKLTHSRFIKTLIISTIITFSLGTANAQHVIDQVLGVVGSEKVLLSDIEQEHLRLKMQGVDMQGDVKCEVFEDLLVHKLLIHQAAIDSIEVGASMVEGEMDRRLRYFINQIGSEAELEKYFNKSIFQIKNDLRKSIKESLVAQQMQESIVKKVAVTPSDVKKLFRNFPVDSLPTIPEQYEIRQIVLYPPASGDSKLAVREQLLDLRERILKGERFSTLAVAYSEDRATVARGGELGFRTRDELVKSFADVAFNLKEGQVSQIVESEYGFHLIQMIERRNEQVNVRHILMKPSYSQNQLTQSLNKLDSIAILINSDSITFKIAAQRFSEDEKTRLSGGLMINPKTNTSLFEKEQLAPADYYVIKTLKVGENSAPFESRDEHANVVNKIVTVTRIIPQHKASIEQDYAIIQQMAVMQKKEEVFTEWTQKKINTTFIRIDPSFQNCNFEYSGWVK
ncbi:MAG: peptidylprolyl isomerase [Bacteroidales bacterium]|jgi:peptidyl-prolyl cis-trans isomerase SurA|nr:peptidylprolyl isomerase [Bacteroidales bacterium]MDD4384719.1 peptidylprolyl isomerase [Bacteroidales bacterium]MDY0196213.1 peptidylprolyl isomerase [Tenuifilaceae bacterium]